MSIRQYFSYSILLRALAAREDTAIGAVAIREANESVKRALEKQASQQKAKKRRKDNKQRVV